VNEVNKTGLFWATAGIVLAIAAVVAWPTASREEGSVSARVNQDLFDEFKDPLAAASMKIVTFDEEQGKLATFEVRKDRESGLWTIPSRDGYPADAVAQMRDAANALVSLKILDVQTENVEDHDKLGVVEPKLEDLKVGDTGVGRLVTFKDDSQSTLASLIIGDPVKDREGQIYVRKPGQDPVYVVALDDSPLTTQFNAWIEDDLLQLSSINVQDIEIKDYNAALSMGGLSLTRNYTARLSMDGSQWKLDELLDYDEDNPNADPKTVTLDEDQELNTTKLNDLKNALDDLKIADVVRKPKGMSENLRADKELVSDNQAVASLAQRGFYPASVAGGEVEIISANGELVVGLNDGVQYVMRFGNVSGLADENQQGGEAEGESVVSAGVNRYLLVTTQVDESKFPPPELRPVPQSLEELEALLAPELQPAATPDGSDATDQEPEVDEDDETPPMNSEDQVEKPEADTDQQADEAETKDAETESSATAEPDAEAAEVSEVEGTTESAGSGEAAVRGAAQEESADEPSDLPAADGDASDKPAAEKSDDASSASDDAKTSAEDQSPQATPAADPSETGDDTAAPAEAKSELDGLTDEEKQERLEAEQEKITKENQRKLDERKDKVDAAKRRVRDLNARFADWYYVIPEQTYGQLRIDRSDLIQSASDPAASGAPMGMPPGGFPPGGGFPGGFPGN